MAIAWEQRLAVGVPLIDQQHKELIDALARLLAAMSASRGKEEVTKLLQFLGEYTVTHFTAEEQLMRTHRYPEYAAHRAEHEAFVAEFRALAADLAKSGPTTSLAIKLNGKVCEWLRQHIAGDDRRLGAFLAQAQAPRATR